MTELLSWGSASRRGLYSLSSNTHLVVGSETPHTATNLSQSKTCRGPDCISVAEVLFRHPGTWRRGAARSLPGRHQRRLCPPGWQFYQSYVQSAMDRRRRSNTRRSLSGTGMSMLSGHVSLSSRSTFVPIPPLLSTKSVILLTSTSLPFTHLTALQISRIPASGQHPHGAW